MKGFHLVAGLSQEPIGRQAAAERDSATSLAWPEITTALGPSGRSRGNYSSELSGRSRAPVPLRRQTVQRAKQLPSAIVSLALLSRSPVSIKK